MEHARSAVMGRYRDELSSERTEADEHAAVLKDRLGRMFDDHHELVRRRVRRWGLSTDKADDP